MGKRRPLVLAAGLGLAALLLATAGGLAGHAVATSGDGPLRDDLQAALEAREELGAKDAEVARLGELIASSGGLNSEYEVLQRQSAALDEQFVSLQAEYDELARSWARLTPVETPDLSGVALYLDQSGGQIAVTRPLCTGSMEPTITCDDLLILYEPASLTDLDEGDVIYFRKPNADCSDYLEGRFTLHRINNVISRSDGIWFETKGDAFVSVDRCLVPAEAVEFKLLTTVPNGRVG